LISDVNREIVVMQAYHILMTITLKPETERLVQEEIRNGHFQNVDELIVKGVQAWRERNPNPLPAEQSRRSAAEIVKRMQEMRKGNRLPAGMTIRGLIDEGRA